MQVFKFGGASVNSVEAIKNMAHIVADHIEEPLVVVVSAMGKTTNLLEKIIPGIPKSEEERRELIEQTKKYHLDIATQLLPNDDPTLQRLNNLFDQLDKTSSQIPTTYNFDYDRVVSFGEIISTTLISGYLNSIGINNKWIDVRQIIRTDENYREGIVDFETTRRQAQEIINSGFKIQNSKLIITQGFIAGTVAGTTTTLGREGSDYSASILSYCLDADSMTIWKDVPGFLNADPKFFANTVKINKIPFNEAIELAYYGASVIHPKTVKPIQNKGICLNIKSFKDPTAEGSVIGPFKSIEPLTPLYIFKNDQVLISIQPKDFSFIAEENLQTIFAVLAELNVRVNIMQNSALSFSLCMNHNEILLKQIRERLESQFRLVYNTGLQLITIRYYNQQIIDEIVGGRNIILQQRSRTITQILVDSK
ncbi:MAG: aspartate kinase [Bacteroidales bacterium]|nr:aspartate kinase [Bacteroidales bacterium]